MSFSRAKTDGWVDGVDRLTAAQLNTMDANVANGIDAVQGGTVAVSNTFAHLYLNNSSLLMASPGAMTAVIPFYQYSNITDVAGTPDFRRIAVAPTAQLVNAWYQVPLNKGTRPTLDFVCKAPHGCLLNGATAFVFPTPTSGVRGGLPGGLPRVFITVRNTTTDTTSAGITGTDLSLNEADYETLHAVSANGLAHTFDAENEVIWISFGGEFTSRNAAGFYLAGMRLNFTPAEYDFRGCVR